MHSNLLAMNQSPSVKHYSTLSSKITTCGSCLRHDQNRGEISDSKAKSYSKKDNPSLKQSIARCRMVHEEATTLLPREEYGG